MNRRRHFMPIGEISATLKIWSWRSWNGNGIVSPTVFVNHKDREVARAGQMYRLRGV